MLPNLRITLFWMFSVPPLLNWIPSFPVPAPSMIKPRRLITSPGFALIVMALPLVTRMLAQSRPVMVVDLVMVTAP